MHLKTKTVRSFDTCSACRPPENTSNIKGPNADQQRESKTLLAANNSQCFALTPARTHTLQCTSRVHKKRNTRGGFKHPPLIAGGGRAWACARPKETPLQESHPPPVGGNCGFRTSRCGLCKVARGGARVGWLIGTLHQGFRKTRMGTTAKGNGKPCHCVPRGDVKQRWQARRCCRGYVEADTTRPYTGQNEGHRRLRHSVISARYPNFVKHDTRSSPHGNPTSCNTIYRSVV